MPRLPGILLAGLLAVPLLVGPATVSTASPSLASARITAWPAVSQIRIIGRTVRHRPIWAYRIGDPSSPVKAVFIATMHGEEPGPARILLNLRNGAPITGADIWVVPYFNVDGYLRHRRMNAHGVDLNRNFPVDWVRRHGIFNSGRHRASEPETRAMMAFLTAIRPTYVVSLHQPLFGVDTSYGKAQSLALRLSEGLGLPRKVFSCNGPCRGTMTEWFNSTLPGAALTVEYGASMTTRQATITGPNGLLAAVGASR